MPEIIPIAEFEKNFDFYLDRCESGETFFIEHTDGKLVAMVPAKEFEETTEQTSENWSTYNDHNDAC